MDEAKRRKADGHKPVMYVAGLDDATELLDTLGDRVAAIFLCVGERGHLTEERAAAAAEQWRSVLARNIECLWLHVAGYDDDPRELFEIDEVCAYLKLFVQHADLTVAQAVKLIPDSQGCAFLAACGAFGEHYRRVALSTYLG
jgi:hypothetical protein